MVDSPYRVAPGEKLNLKKRPTDDAGPFKDKEQAAPESAKNLEKLDELQQLLYAEGERAVLVVFQAMDAGGKDGAIEHVFSGLNPQGCQVTSFKQPTPLELRHDFLWRIHDAAPPKGMIGIFNRSHYESVLVERVHSLVPEKVWKKRYDHINQFERLLSDEGTVVLKFFLHISKDEQKRRLEARLRDAHKNWKFDIGDLREREHWDEYQRAFEDALQKCSTEHAPWYIVPADRKWFRNWVVGDVLVRTLEQLKMKYPKPKEDLSGIVVK
ncbi:MAG TPA: polyphosphate kinase 2 family protein [Tepidisphaeraceae bacterium]|nr:polyphosphate kinase 2 family protein [Tepidisphaeraceae bacterium]